MIIWLLLDISNKLSEVIKAVSPFQTDYNTNHLAPAVGSRSDSMAAVKYGKLNEQEDLVIITTLMQDLGYEGSLNIIRVN